MTVLSVVATLLASCSLDAAALDGVLAPEPQHAQVGSLVVTYLEQYHYTGQKLDDDMSQRWLSNYLDALDYGHMVFLQSDIDRFTADYGTSLDERAGTDGMLEPGFEIYNVYRERMEERLLSAQAVLAGPIDLTDDESWNPDGHDAPWPATADDAATRWRQRVEEQILQRDLRGSDRDKTIEMLQKRYARLLKSVNDANANDVMEAYLGALTTAFDPHSYWFSPPDHDNFEIEMSKSLEGIGARLQTIDEYTVVQSLVPGGPAKRDGELKPQDKIIAVAQGDSEFEDVVDRRIDEVVKLIRGPKGTVVRLRVIPAGEDETVTEIVDIRRDEVVLEENRAEATVREITGPDGKVRQIAVIDVPSFYQGMTSKSQGQEYQSTTKDVLKLLAELESQNIDSVLLDLRYNGGGSLDESLMLTGLFVAEGPVVQVRTGEGQVEVLDDPDKHLVYDGPLVVATGPLSASASEILAGAIQDYGRGLIVGGRQTHGKGSVQAVIDLDPQLSGGFGGVLTSLAGGRSGPGGGALKITSQMFFRVNGESTQNRGVVPDIRVPSPWDETAGYEGDLDYALPWASIDAATFQPWKGSTVDLAALQSRSDARVAEIDEFRWWAEDDAEREAEEGQPVSLVLEERRAEFEARKAKLEARGRDVEAELAAADAEELGEAETEDEDEDEPDPVLDEILAVTADYLAQLEAPAEAASADEPAKPSKRKRRAR